MRLSASECLPHQVLSAAIERSSAGRVGGSVLGFVAGREAITQLLRLHKDIDLVIPRGSNAMVQHIMSSTRIPTLGHADGICHLYVDAKITGVTTLYLSTPRIRNMQQPMTQLTNCNGRFRNCIMRALK